MRHRMNPIPGSYVQVPGYPDKLKLCKIGASKFWQIRFYLDGKILKRSAKTVSQQQAIRAAKAFWDEIHVKRSQNLPVTSSASFERAASDLLVFDQERVERGERKPRLVSDQRFALNNHILKFFKGHGVKDVNFKKLTSFADHLRKAGLSQQTIKTQFNYVRKVLKHAHKMDLLDRMPTFPTTTVQDRPRPWLTADQYVKLRKTVAREIKKKTVVRAHQITDEMRHLITFMVNTFLRPGDLKELRHKNIEVVKTKDAQYLRITPSTGKTNISPTVSMPAAVEIYADLVKLNGNNSEDHVFFPHLKNRQFAYDTIHRQFKHVLEVAGLRTTAAGDSRTLYSLRHTAIMLRLVKGDSIDLLTLARNARTSVQMIERFYAKHLTAEMNVGKLHSMR
jgi:integrase